ncbi:S-layer homology domain-containing protein [Salibacterium aidingense]|uniref:S-layer homology domain-containing protein n=1 Tax=Salibacterium aidingense TaxID=384933 RepID=UPI003BBAFE18
MIPFKQEHGRPFHWKSAFASVFLVSFMYISMAVNAEAADFTDVDDNYWASEEIQWSQEHELLQGYEDGSFHPGDEMTEAQFSTILTRHFGLDTEAGMEEQHWAQPAYSALSRQSLRLPGLRENAVKNRAVTRGTIAQALAHSQAGEPGLKEAVAWMFEESLTTGRQEGDTQTERFDVNGKLTRAQAAVFFKRLHDNGYTVWKADELLDMTSEGSNQYTEMVRPLYNEAGVTLYAQNANSFATANEEYYHLFQAYQGEKREFAVARTTRDNFELAADAAETLGAPESAEDILEGLIAADESSDSQEAGAVEIIPRTSDIFLLWEEQNE